MQYNIDDPEQFVDKWMAFSINKFAGAEPTIQYLTDFENNELKNKIPATKSKRSGLPERSQIKVYHQDSDDEENDLLGNYVCITPKVSEVMKLERIFSFIELRSSIRSLKTPDKHENSRTALSFNSATAGKLKFLNSPSTLPSSINHHQLKISRRI